MNSLFLYYLLFIVLFIVINQFLPAPVFSNEKITLKNMSYFYKVHIYNDECIYFTEKTDSVNLQMLNRMGQRNSVNDPRILGKRGGWGGTGPEKQVSPSDPTTEPLPWTNPRPFALPAKPNGFSSFCH